MSTAPKVAGVPNGLIYGFIGGAVLVLLLCSGAAIYLLVGRGGSSNPIINPTGSKVIDQQDALKYAQGFAKRLAEEDYGEALKNWSTAGFRKRYPSAEDLKTYVESEGKGLIGGLQFNIRSLDTEPKMVKVIGQVGGGPNGVARFEMTLVDEGEGIRVADLIFKK